MSVSSLVGERMYLGRRVWLFPLHTPLAVLSLYIKNYNNGKMASPTPCVFLAVADVTVLRMLLKARPVRSARHLSY